MLVILPAVASGFSTTPLPANTPLDGLLKLARFRTLKTSVRNSRLPRLAQSADRKMLHQGKVQVRQARSADDIRDPPCLKIPPAQV